MFNKNDPLIGSVTKVMQENQARRDAITVINEAFGITDKRHLPFQAHAEYDALVEEMTQEALVGGQAKLDVNRNNRLDKQDFKMLRGMKKKPMAENPEETAKSVKTAADVQNSNKDMCEEPQTVNTAAKSDRLDTTKTAPQSTITLKPLNKPGLPKLGGMTVAKKNMEEAMTALAPAIAGIAPGASGGSAAGGTSATSMAAGRAVERPHPGVRVGKPMKPTGIAPGASGGSAGAVGKPMTEEEVDEATLSAKAARAGKDIGKKRKMFAKIAASAANRYGSEERGKKVAGAILKKMRAKAGMEEEVVQEAGAPVPAVVRADQKRRTNARITAQQTAREPYDFTGRLTKAVGPRLRPGAGGGVRGAGSGSTFNTPGNTPVTMRSSDYSASGPRRGGAAAGTQAAPQTPVTPYAGTGESGPRRGGAALQGTSGPRRGGAALGTQAIVPKVAAKPVTTTVRGPTTTATIQGPMKAGYQLAAVKTDAGQSYKGSVVNSGKQGVKIQGFTAGGSGPTTGKKS